MFELMFVVVIGTSIWVYVDAKNMGVKKGQLKGVCDMGPGGWFIACLLLWIAGFPMYLANRSELQRINGKSGSPAVAPPVPGSQHESQDFEVQLTKLARLKDSGVLSEEEFTAKKKAILGL
jgi:hypothetical protein